MTIALMMEAVRTFESMVNLYQSTRRYNPEDSHLRTHRRKNFKSYSVEFIDTFVDMLFTNFPLNFNIYF
jgi:hypothetical protein